MIENSKKRAKKFEKLKNKIMASFEDKIGWKRSRTRENQNYRSVPNTPVIQNSKKIAKNFKQLKNTIMVSFQAKIGTKRLRKRENKNYCSVPFQPVA